MRTAVCSVGKTSQDKRAQKDGASGVEGEEEEVRRAEVARKKNDATAVGCRSLPVVTEGECAGY
jgi:hypothetical protein